MIKNKPCKRQWRISPRDQRRPVSTDDGFMEYEEGIGRELTDKRNVARGGSKQGMRIMPDHVPDDNEIATIGKEILDLLEKREEDFVRISICKEEISLNRLDAVKMASKILDLSIKLEDRKLYYAKDVAGTWRRHPSLKAS